MTTKILNGEEVEMTAPEETTFRAGQAVRHAAEVKENADEATEKSRSENTRASAVAKLKAMGLTQEETEELGR